MRYPLYLFNIYARPPGAKNDSSLRSGVMALYYFLVCLNQQMRLPLTKHNEYKIRG